MDEIKEPYSFSTKYTVDTYKYIINNILDKDREVDGYKSIRPNPSRNTKVYIANEIYAYFLSHYFKAIDAYLQNNTVIDKFKYSEGDINIIDVGANIGTVTFAYLDLLVTNKAINNSINIIFIEVDDFRSGLLNKAIERYKEVSKLNINYKIINKCYEEALNDVYANIHNGNTMILISNLLRWISDMNIFKTILLDNIQYIDSKYECIVINIETKSFGANERLIELYKNIDKEELGIRCNEKKMPQFKNIDECYFYQRYGNIVYKTNNEYYYGYIIRDLELPNTKNLDYIEKAYYKALYTVRNYFLYDNLETKYISSNLEEMKSFIYETMNDGQVIEDYQYQYRMRKSKDKTRPLYIDDFIDDIINTSIIITKGLIYDRLQNDDISYGNRVNEDLESPFTFNIYYTQFFDKYKKRQKEYANTYKYYYKIDLERYYNNVEHNKLDKIIKKPIYISSNWYNRKINKFINSELYDCEKGYGLAQGPDLSHLLANMYLKEFDDWFCKKHNNMRLLRYVDDMVIFGNNQKECEKVYNSSKRYLKEELNLKIGEAKTEQGSTNELLEESDDKYYEEVINESNLILRSLYKLDKNNYNKYKKDTEKFITIYRKCLNKIGIYLTKDWLSVKINKELGFLERIKRKFKEDKKLLIWTNKKNIYDIKLKLGVIPNSTSDNEIDKWAEIFMKNNKKFIEKIYKLITLLDSKLEETLTYAENNENEAKALKSIFKFTMNRLQIFKCTNMSAYIEKIFKYFPYCNKKVFSTYDELFEFIKNNLKKENKRYDLYDYAIYIWLLGEYRKEDSLNIFEELFKDSYYDNQYFINTLVTEAILKIGTVRKNFKNNLLSIIHESNNYYIVRNILLLLNIAFNRNELDNILKDISMSINDERISIFIRWLNKNKDCNLVDLIDNIPECYKNKYPDYPIGNEYMSL